MSATCDKPRHKSLIGDIFYGLKNLITEYQFITHKLQKSLNCPNAQNHRTKK